jgi:capsular exopolysaccharide synthesis family protein
MSEFFRALERAERERAERGTHAGRGRRAEAGTAEGAEPTAAERASPAAGVPAADATPTVQAAPADGDGRRRPGAGAPEDAGGTRPDAAHRRDVDIARDITAAGRRRTERPGREQAPVEPESDGDGVDSHLVMMLTPGAFEAEQYLVLRHRVEQLRRDEGVHVVAITSPGAGDGKTTTAINLAGALGQDPRATVLLVEADLRQPSVAERLGLLDDGSGGLIAVVRGECALADAVRVRPPFNLSVLPAGPAARSPYDLIAAPGFAALLAEAVRRYDFVIVDTPPMVPFPDTRVMAKSIDRFFVVVAAHRTPRKMLEETLNAMEPAKVAGLVFNADDAPASRYYYPAARPRGIADASAFARPSRARSSTVPGGHR